MTDQSRVNFVGRLTRPEASTFTVANLYYVQPIFTKLAHDFNVTYERSSNIATLLQAGYAGGILLILPLGDILERRPLVIGLIAVTATLVCCPGAPSHVHLDHIF